MVISLDRIQVTISIVVALIILCIEEYAILVLTIPSIGSDSFALTQKCFVFSVCNQPSTYGMLNIATKSVLHITICHTHGYKFQISYPHIYEERCT